MYSEILHMHSLADMSFLIIICVRDQKFINITKEDTYVDSESRTQMYPFCVCRCKKLQGKYLSQTSTRLKFDINTVNKEKRCSSSQSMGIGSTHSYCEIGRPHRNGGRFHLQRVMRLMIPAMNVSKLTVTGLSVERRVREGRSSWTRMHENGDFVIDF